MQRMIVAVTYKAWLIAGGVEGGGGWGGKRWGEVYVVVWQVA